MVCHDRGGPQLIHKMLIVGFDITRFCYFCCHFFTLQYNRSKSLILTVFCKNVGWYSNIILDVMSEESNNQLHSSCLVYNWHLWSHGKWITLLEPILNYIYCKVILDCYSDNTFGKQFWVLIPPFVILCSAMLFSTMLQQDSSILYMLLNYFLTSLRHQ